MASNRASSYVSRFGPLIRLGRLKPGSPEEQFARHRYRFAAVPFNLV